MKIRKNKSGTVRWSTLVAKLGQPSVSRIISCALNDGSPLLQRVLTIHHSDCGGADYGEKYFGYCNVVETVVFPRPVPKWVRLVIGINMGDVLGNVTGNVKMARVAGGPSRPENRQQMTRKGWAEVWGLDAGLICADELDDCMSIPFLDSMS
jgi:hypothetical protein